MLCENCGENEATIHYTEIINGVRKEHHLCAECAKEFDFSGYTNILSGEFPFVRLLTGLLSANNSVNKDNPMNHICCPQCNMSFEEFAKLGKFGCAECYNVFGPLIDDNMKRIHGDNVHKGRIYKGHNKTTDGEDNIKENISDTVSKVNKADNTESDIKELSARLKEAVLIEDFEEAARLRDAIKALKEGKDNNA